MAESNQSKNFVKDEDINEYSPIFDDFTTEWIGDQEFSVASFNEGEFSMGKEGRKRKLEVDFSCEGESQAKKPRLSEENLIISTFRENFPEKFQKFELKMITSSESSLKPSDETPNSQPSDETPNSQPSDETPNSQPSDETPNVQPTDNSTISTPKPTDEDSIDQYSPQSPDLFIPAPTAQYVLQPELLALAEFVDSMRVDLLQTSTLVSYIQDYVSRLDFRKQ
eukprot:XP_011417906.1 PREDICTED: uncharacterized protein LOC105321337 [Crassostrea gigas]